MARNLVGEIYSRFEKAGLKIIASRMLLLSEEQAAGFYAEHDGKPFYEDLCAYMRSGPVMIQVLEGEDAILANESLWARRIKRGGAWNDSGRFCRVYRRKCCSWIRFP